MNSLAPKRLLTFFKFANPKLLSPIHLPELTQAFEQATYIPLRKCFSTPPQTGKSILTLTGLIWFGWKKPGTTSAYCSYSDDITMAQSDRAWKIATTAGLKPTGTKASMTLSNGSIINFVSVRGPLEGKPVDGILILDDPYKDRPQAESDVERSNVSDWFFSTALGRLHPSSSVFVIGHRWTPDDLIADLQIQGWEWRNYPALDEHDNSIWEELKPAAWFIEQRKTVGEYEWASSYLGQPRPRDGKLFRGITHWTEEQLKDIHLQIAIGVDCAVTAKTHADYSAYVVLGEHNAHWYVLEAYHAQVELPTFVTELKRVKASYPGAQMMWETSTTEKGGADLMRSMGVPISSRLAVGDPYLRSQKLSAQWNNSMVHMPAEEKPWMPEFLKELNNFTGINDKNDDQMAAFASAFSMLPPHPVLRKPAYGSLEHHMEMEAETFKKRELEVQKQIHQTIRNNRREERNRRRDRWSR